MIRSKILNIAGLFIFLFLVSNQKISAQKIDSDSLLTVIIKDMQNEIKILIEDEGIGIEDNKFDYIDDSSEKLIEKYQ